MDASPRYRDLVKHEFSDETSQFDPQGYWVGGSEYYARDYTVYIPARLVRRAPDLIDAFIDKYSEEAWLWGVEKLGNEYDPTEIDSFDSFMKGEP
jgi:hypothetical protein